MFIFAFVTFMFMAQVGTVDHDQPLQIHSVNMRPARKNDIGLYFGENEPFFQMHNCKFSYFYPFSDIVVINSIISGGYEETLPIAVHSDKCCVKDPKSREMNCDVSDDDVLYKNYFFYINYNYLLFPQHIQIVGGDFGQLEPGKSVIFSTILPTLVSLNKYLIEMD